MFGQKVILLLVTGCALYVTGVTGLILNRKNIIIAIMTLEILLLAVNINFLNLSFYLGHDTVGEMFVFFIFSISASESSIGLAVLLGNFQVTGSAKLRNIKFI